MRALLGATRAASAAAASTLWRTFSCASPRLERLPLLFLLDRAGDAVRAGDFLLDRAGERAGDLLLVRAEVLFFLELLLDVDARRLVLSARLGVRARGERSG